MTKQGDVNQSEAPTTIMARACDITWEECVDEADNAREFARATKTSKNYESHINQFKTFCDKMKRRHNGATVKVISAWLGWRIKARGCKASTLRVGITAIKHFYRENGWSLPDLSKKNPEAVHLIWDVIKGQERRNPKQPKRGMTMDDMVKIHQKIVRMKDQKAKRDELTIYVNQMVNFATIRRGSETLRKNVGGARFGDIRFGGKRTNDLMEIMRAKDAVFVFNDSKMNKEGKLQTALMLCQCNESRGWEGCVLCVVKDYYVSQKDLDLNAAMWMLSTGETVQYKDQLGFIKYWTKQIGLDPKEYGTHSMRRGGYWDCKKAGFAKEFTDAQAGWGGQHTAEREYSEKAFQKQRKKRLLASQKLCK